MGLARQLLPGQIEMEGGYQVQQACAQEVLLRIGSGIRLRMQMGMEAALINGSRDLGDAVVELVCCLLACGETVSIVGAGDCANMHIVPARGVLWNQLSLFIQIYLVISRL